MDEQKTVLAYASQYAQKYYFNDELGRLPEEVKKEILAYCREHIAKYAMPYDIEFRDEMPKTLVGKVNFRVLEQQEMEKIAREEAAKAQEAEEASK